MQEQLPGRLGDPSMTLLTDPRMDPRVVNLLAASGDLLDGIEPLESNASSHRDCRVLGTFVRARLGSTPVDGEVLTGNHMTVIGRQKEGEVGNIFWHQSLGKCDLGHPGGFCFLREPSIKLSLSYHPAR